MDITTIKNQNEKIIMNENKGTRKQHYEQNKEKL